MSLCFGKELFTYVCNCKHYKTYNSRGMRVVVCTDLWGKELHRQVDAGIMVTSGKPTWCNGYTLAWDARYVGSSPVLGTVFLIFITPTTYIVRITKICQLMHALDVDIKRHNYTFIQRCWKFLKFMDYIFARKYMYINWRELIIIY